MGQLIHMRRPDGANVDAYAAGAAQSRAGLVVIQEWWGLNDQIRSVADRYAQAGFQVVTPDLYHGRVTQDMDEARHMMDGLDFPGATHQDIRAAVDHLKQSCDKVGILGFCMGGALTIAAAVHVPNIAAAVCFYGIPPAPFADPANIKIPFQGHFAKHDDWCTPQLVDALEHAMRAAGARPEIYRYDANHAFFNHSRPEVYDQASADLAWTRTLHFLKTHLG